MASFSLLGEVTLRPTDQQAVRVFGHLFRREQESSSSSIFCFSTADWKLALRADSPCPVSVCQFGQGVTDHSQWHWSGALPAKFM